MVNLVSVSHHHFRGPNPSISTSTFARVTQNIRHGGVPTSTMAHSRLLTPALLLITHLLHLYLMYMHPLARRPLPLP